MQEIIRDIRKRCRMAMNGIVSTSMRERGLTYKINFGLTISQIKDLSKHYQPNAELAETLWIEDTRELKLLATLLYPINDFTEEKAETWVVGVSNQELREQICINLFEGLQYADKLAIGWANNADLNIRTTGYWLLVRLLLSKKVTGLQVDQFKFILADVVSEETFLRNASVLALKHLGRQSKDEADCILNKLLIYKDDENLLKQEAYNSVSFEFEYFFEK